MGVLGLWKGGSWQTTLYFPKLVWRYQWEPAALFSHHQITAVFGSVVVGSAKTHTSNFHTICKRLIRKAFLFNIKQVRKKCHQLISAVPDFHWEMAAGELSCVEASVGFLKWLNGEQYISLLKSHMPFGLNIKVPLRLSKY